MKTPQGTWWVLLSLAGWLCFGQPAGGQTQAPNEATKVEAEDSTAEKTNATAPAEPAETAKPSERGSYSGGGINREAVVNFGQNVELKSGETAEVVVVIGGSAKIHGKVRDSVVVIGGDVEVDGEVEQQVVAVMGSVHVRSEGRVQGDVVSVGGKLQVDDGARIRGHTQEVAIAGMRMPHADWIQKWISSCLLMLRPLSPRVGWVWIVALVHFLVFLFIAAVFRTPVQSCVNELTTRPTTTFLMGLLTKMLLPLVIIILFVLVVGIVVVPFIGAAILVLGLVGKVAVLEAVGFSVGRLFGQRPVEGPVVALIIGSGLLALLYMIPVVGLLTMLLLSVWGLGCAITAAFRGFRREIPERPASAAAPLFAPAMATAAAAAPAPAAPFAAYQSQAAPATAPLSAAAGGEPATGGPAATATATFPGEPPVMPLVMPDVLVYPKATFWERIAAGFLDLIFVVIVGAFLGSPTAALIVGLAYVTGLWAWKGTTVGGVVLGLKVVRIDGQPVTFVVALVRGLAAGFSAVVLFLGFLWMAWDPDKQGWHDKIAGTVVLRLPRGTPLVCV